MERLTRYIGSRAASTGDMGDLKYVRATIDRLAAYEDTGLEPSEIPTGLELANVFAALQELKQYRDAEDQGLLVWLPCKIEGKVFKKSNFSKGIVEGTVQCITISGFGFSFKATTIGEMVLPFDKEDIGKTVFFTRKAAESALAEMTDTAVK